jgi:hypothetical protein
MKLDPGMHIVMHLVFFGKTDVTCVASLCRLIRRMHAHRVSQRLVRIRIVRMGFVLSSSSLVL